MREGGLHPICEEARCPNIGECWGRGTATFQILGDTCTRACRYCYVHSGKPDGPPDPLEPLRLAQAAAQMKLSCTSSSPRSTATTSPTGGQGTTPRRSAPSSTNCPPRRSRSSHPTSSASRKRRSRPSSRRGPRSSTTTSRRCGGSTHACAAPKASYDKALWLLARREGARRLPGTHEIGNHRRPRRDERRGRRHPARPSGARRRRRHHRPVPATARRSTRRSTAGCTPTSSAGSASRERNSGSARSSRARSCARRIARTSSATRPRPAAVPSPTSNTAPPCFAGMR